MSLRYWLLPDVEQYRENIASAISRTSGQHVTIGEVRAEWDGFRPHMMLRTIKIHDKEDNLTLLLDRLEGTLSWLSLVHGELRFRDIEIEQPDLIVRRDSSGVIHVAGFALNGELTGSGNGFFDWLLSQRQVIINNASILWQDDQRRAPELELLVDLRLENRGNRHRFGIRATPPVELAAQLDMRGDFIGESLDSLEQWRGQLFAQIDQADLAAWGAWLPFSQQIQLHRGSGALRVWVGMNGADITKLTADMRLHNVKTQLARDLPELSLHRLQGRVGWQKIHDGTKAGIEMFAHNLDASVPGKRKLQPVNFFLRMMPAQGKSSSGKLNVSKLNLEILGHLAPYLPISMALREQFNQTSPRGEIHHMRAKWDGEWPTPTYFSAKGGFTDLSMKKNKSLPAFSGMTGNIDVNERGGTLNLNSQQVRLELPDFFNGPLALDAFTGQASWNFLPGSSIAFKFNNVSFSNAHTSGLVHGSYRFVPDGPGVIDLVGQLTRGDTRYLGHYIPTKANHYFHDLFDKSNIEGELVDARLHLKGNLAEFPFDSTDTGIFRFHAKASRIALDIPGWPRIEDISGHLQFHDGLMKFDASQATISGTRLSKAKVRIADMTAFDAMLESEGEISGPTGEFLRFAAKYTGDTLISNIVEDIRITGTGKLLFTLDIPLHHTGDSKLAGSYQFIDNQVNPGPRIPNLDKINGMLIFTGSGMRIENVTAQFLGGPVIINSAPTPDGSTRLSATGKANLDNLHEAGRRVSGTKVWERHLQGSTDWRAAIHIHDKLVDVSVESSLQGLASDLPAPFSKAATDIAPLRFERKATGLDKDVLNLNYAGLVTARINRSRDDAGNYHAERGIVNFGMTTGIAGILPDKPGISVNGTLPLLDLDQWRGLLQQFDDKPGPSLNLTDIDLHIGTLDLLGRRLNDIAFNASKDEGLWHSTVTSREIKGGVSWKLDGNGKVVARLRTLVMPAASPANPGFVMQTRQEEKNLPALDVIADSFTVGEKQLGRLELIASPQEQSWLVEKLHITNSDSSLIANGIWQSRATPPRIQASIKLEASDIGEFLTHLGYPDRVKRGSGELEGVLSWYGSLRSVDYPTLSGSFKMKARRGQFPKFEPGIGRLFGMFDLRALPRRITLDFRDVFSEGFGFDDISGDVKVVHGVAITDDFRIQGPAARIVMKGELNLEAETQKLHVTVTPSLGLATPVVGIVSKALQNPSRSNEYNVTGTWADPSIIRIPRHTQESREHEQ